MYTYAAISMHVKARTKSRVKGANRLVAVKSSLDSGAVTFQTAEFDALGRRMKKVVQNSGDLNATFVYTYNGHKIIETRNGSNAVVQQFIHGTRYIDELIMARVKGKGDLYVHQGERSERENAATGKASREACVRGSTCPDGVSTKRTTEGANWNVIALTDLGGSVVERYNYTPYGEPTVHQGTGYGDRDGDGDVDATDKGTPGSTCTGTVTGACRILDLDLDFDGDYDSTDATKFDALTQGLARHPGRTATAVHQPFAHQGLLFEPELGSYQNRARQYDPAKRRFVQRDPLGLLAARFSARQLYRDGLNSYQYARCGPLVRIDPTGRYAYYRECSNIPYGGPDGWITCTGHHNPQARPCVHPRLWDSWCMKECTFQHESVHARFCNDNDCCHSFFACDEPDSADVAQEECAAYEKEVSCLEGCLTSPMTPFAECTRCVVLCMAYRGCELAQGDWDPACIYEVCLGQCRASTPACMEPGISREPDWDECA